MVDRPAVDYVRRLKQQDGGDLGIPGSIDLGRSLLQSGLVDELQLVVAPVLANRGRRLFNGGHDLRKLELLDSDRTPRATSSWPIVSRLSDVSAGRRMWSG